MAAPGTTLVRARTAGRARGRAPAGDLLARSQHDVVRHFGRDQHAEERRRHGGGDPQRRACMPELEVFDSGDIQLAHELLASGVLAAPAAVPGGARDQERLSRDARDPALRQIAAAGRRGLGGDGHRPHGVPDRRPGLPARRPRPGRSRGQPLSRARACSRRPTRRWSSARSRSSSCSAAASRAPPRRARCSACRSPVGIGLGAPALGWRERGRAAAERRLAVEDEQAAGGDDRGAEQLRRLGQIAPDQRSRAGSPRPSGCTGTVRPGRRARAGRPAIRTRSAVPPIRPDAAISTRSDSARQDERAAEGKPVITTAR